MKGGGCIKSQKWAFNGFSIAFDDLEVVVVGQI